jgi:phage terminase small subunit
MARGRKPTAPALKVLTGTKRPDRERVDAPEFDLVDVFPDAPQHLSSDGAEMWRTLGPQLVAARVLQVVDLYSLEQLCFAWQCFRKKAKADMESTAAETTALKALFSEFGMTPASRSKVASGGEKPKGNKFADNGRRP